MIDSHKEMQSQQRSSVNVRSSHSVAVTDTTDDRHRLAVFYTVAMAPLSFESITIDERPDLATVEHMTIVSTRTDCQLYVEFFPA